MCEKLNKNHLYFFGSFQICYVLDPRKINIVACHVRQTILEISQYYIFAIFPTTTSKAKHRKQALSSNKEKKIWTLFYRKYS